MVALASLKEAEVLVKTKSSGSPADDQQRPWPRWTVPSQQGWSGELGVTLRGEGRINRPASVA